jgi:histone deacetylase complex subunit SAP18
MAILPAQTCPFMLRTYIRPGSHSEIHLFNPANPAQQRAEHSLYVWKDVTLRELVILLRSVNPTALGKGNARFSIRHVYAASDRDRDTDRDSRRQEWDYRDLGLVFARDLTGKNALHSEGHGRSGGRNDPSNRTLDQHRFIPGDFIEVAYMSPTAGGPQSAAGEGGRAGGPAGNVIPSLSIQGRAGALSGRIGAAQSEADQAWGVAGEQRQRPFGRGGGAGHSAGGGRVNPLLTGRGGISILGQSRRRQSQSEANSGVNGQRPEDKDGDQNMD